MPRGLRFENSSRRKKPDAVGGITNGSVRTESIRARVPLRRPMIHPAARMPRKKHRIVAASPVVREISRGLQSSFCKNAVISLSIIRLRYSVFGNLNLRL